MGRRGLLIVAAAALTAAAAATALAAIVSLAELAEKQVQKAAGRIDPDIDYDKVEDVISEALAEDTDDDEIMG